MSLTEKKLELAIRWLNDIKNVRSATSMLATAALAEIEAAEDQYPLGSGAEGDLINENTRLKFALEKVGDEMFDDTSRRAQRINKIISEALADCT